MKTSVIKIHPRLMAAFAFVMIALSTQAQIGVSNLGGVFTGGTYPTAGQLLGQSFSTDDSAAQFNLETVTLAMYQTSGTVDGFSVSVYSDAGGLPSAYVGTLSGDTSPSAPATLTYYSYTTDSIILSASTTYWIVWGFTAPEDGGVTTSGFAVLAGSTGAWSLGEPAAAPDGGTWSLFEGEGTPTPYGISIEASAVPEPASSALMIGLFVIGLASSRRQRRDDRSFAHRIHEAGA